MELSSLLAHHAHYRPHATAVVFGKQRLDYLAFNARVNRAARLLNGLGVKKSQRVATLLPNTLELLELYWACAKIGAEVAVFGIPHETWGETPIAAVVLKVGAGETAEELRDWVNERVAARYQRVQAVVIMPAFPRNAAGKTLKREMRDPY